MGDGGEGNGGEVKGKGRVEWNVKGKGGREGPQ